MGTGLPRKTMGGRVSVGAGRGTAGGGSAGREEAMIRGAAAGEVWATGLQITSSATARQGRPKAAARAAVQRIRLAIMVVPLFRDTDATGPSWPVGGIPPIHST